MASKTLRFATVILVALSLSGCLVGEFYGRLIVWNNTESDIENITVSRVLGDSEVHECVSSFRLEPGEARVFGRVIYSLCPAIRISRSDMDGNSKVFDVPFEGFMPTNSYDDLWLELSPSGNVSVQIMKQGKTASVKAPVASEDGG